jgi:dihydroorotate dehydrogenase (fumarate)
MDLTTHYLGLNLRNPLVASSSPLNLDVGNICRLEEAGAAAVVLPSIFQEQIEFEAAETERLTSAGSESYAEAASYFPSAASYRAGPDAYLEIIRRARQAAGIPVIASLNGITRSGWIDYAKKMEQAGASAIELNVYYIPSDPALPGAEVEQRYVDVLRAVKAAVSVPVAMKLSPFFSSLGHQVRQLEAAGADGFVLFNRFYQPDIDLVGMRLLRDLELSQPAEVRLPLLWIGTLRSQVKASLAASSGVDSSDDVVKYLLAGADVVMTTSALLRHGVAHMRSLLSGLIGWLEARDVGSVAEIRGKLSQDRVRDRTAYQRANYINILQGWQQPR